jgi:hypothetical protein
MSGELIVFFALIAFVVLAPIVWPASAKTIAGKRLTIYVLMVIGLLATMLITALVTEWQK